MGRLLHLTANPWESTPEAGSAEPQWDLLFEAAGFDVEAFEPTETVWNPPVFSDSQRAWLGSYPEGEQIPIRVEAAGLADKVTWFRVIEPWIEPVVPGVDARLEVFGTPVAFLVWFIIVLVLGGILAWRNLRLGRGDRNGAFRTAVFFGVVRMTWLLAADHIPNGQEIQVLTGHIAYSAYRVWLIWIAVSLQTFMMIAMFMGPGDPLLNIMGSLYFVAVFWWLLFRFGLLSALVLFMVGDLLAELPLTHDFSAWYVRSTWMTLLVIAGLTAWGFYVSLAGRPMFKDELFARPEGA